MPSGRASNLMVDCHSVFDVPLLNASRADWSRNSWRETDGVTVAPHNPSGPIATARVTSYASKRTAAPRERGKERLLPLGMLVKDDEIWR